MISHTERQAIQIAQLAKEYMNDMPTNPVKAERLANAASETLERIIDGTDENFDVRLYFMKEISIENNKKPYSVGKGKNDQKEVNIVDQEYNEDENLGGIPMAVLANEEQGYEKVEDKTSLKPTYEMIIKQLSKYGYEKEYFRDTVLSWHNRQDQLALVNLRIIAGIPQVGEYVREFLNLTHSIKFLQNC